MQLLVLSYCLEFVSTSLLFIFSFVVQNILSLIFVMAVSYIEILITFLF